MTNVRRVHGVKYDLSRFTLSELDAAAAHTQRGLREHYDFLRAIGEERRARGAGPDSDAAGRTSPASAIRGCRPARSR